jgi:arylsulfatase A-like enzyme
MSQPAIILITCDELKRDTLSYYGNKAIATPNIDSIAKNGAVFDECYTVSPLCGALPAPLRRVQQFQGLSVKS